MLPKIHRLAKKKDFEVVFNGGTSVRHGFLVAKMVKNNLLQSRFGFVVSKKVSLKATVRNTVKRRLREAVHVHISSIKKPVDVVIVALPGIQKKAFPQIQSDIDVVLEKLNLV